MWLLNYPVMGYSWSFTSQPPLLHKEFMLIKRPWRIPAPKLPQLLPLKKYFEFFFSHMCFGWGEYWLEVGGCDELIIQHPCTQKKCFCGMLTKLLSVMQPSVLPGWCIYCSSILKPPWIPGGIPHTPHAEDTRRSLKPRIFKVNHIKCSLAWIVLVYITGLPLARNFSVPYYMKFWRHFNLVKLAIFLNVANLKCTKINCC